MVTLTPSFDTSKVCYAYLCGHTCCKNDDRCRLRQLTLLEKLTDDDKLILKAVMGEAEEFDQGEQSSEMLRDVLSGKAIITMRITDKQLVPGVSYDNY